MFSFSFNSLLFPYYIFILVAFYVTYSRTFVLMSARIHSTCVFLHHRALDINSISVKFGQYLGNMRMEYPISSDILKYFTLQALSPGRPEPYVALRACVCVFMYYIYRVSDDKWENARVYVCRLGHTKHKIPQLFCKPHIKPHIKSRVIS